MASCKTVFSLHPDEGLKNEKSASQPAADLPNPDS